MKLIGLLAFFIFGTLFVHGQYYDGFQMMLNMVNKVREQRGLPKLCNNA